jgi:GDPmannose 4,6-dehydratase
VQDASLVRPAEVDFLVGDASKACRELDWKPTVGFPELIRLMLEKDLQRLKNSNQAVG